MKTRELDPAERMLVQSGIIASFAFLAAGEIGYFDPSVDVVVTFIIMTSASVAAAAKLYWKVTGVEVSDR